MKESIFTTNISTKQTSDAGMAAVLILLLIGFFTENTLYYTLAIPALIINMTFPRFYYVFAILWFGFSHLLGTVVSKILLTCVYIVLVIPFGIFRRIIGKDPLLLRQFKKGSSSVMIDRNYWFTAKDIEKPY